MADKMKPVGIEDIVQLIQKATQMSTGVGQLQAGIDMAVALNPWQEGVKKGLTKGGEQQALEALMAGVPGAKISNQAGLTGAMAGMPGNASASSSTPVQSTTPTPTSAPSQPGAQTATVSPPLNDAEKNTQLLASLLSLKQQLEDGSGMYMPPTVTSKKASSMFAMGGVDTDEQGNLIVKQPGLIGGTLQALLTGSAKKSQTDDVARLKVQQEISGQTPISKEKLMEDKTKTVIERLKIEQKQSEDGYLKPEKLMTEFEDASKMFIVSRDANARLQEFGTSDTGADDVGLIFSFMKVLDPGSVVREREFATAEQTRGIPQNIVAMYNKALVGTRLTPAQRKEILSAGTRAFKSAERQQARTTSEFHKLAVENRLDPKRIFRDVGMKEKDVSSGKGKKEEEVTITPGGNRYKPVK